MNESVVMVAAIKPITVVIFIPLAQFTPPHTFIMIYLPRSLMNLLFSIGISFSTVSTSEISKCGLLYPLNRVVIRSLKSMPKVRHQYFNPNFKETSCSLLSSVHRDILVKMADASRCMSIYPNPFPIRR